MSSIKITMLFNSALIKSAFPPERGAGSDSRWRLAAPQKVSPPTGFVFNHCFFTLCQRAFYSKLMLVYSAGLLK